MSQNTEYDALVVGSGPNGFSAAITLAQAGLSVAIFEAKATVGGGMRSAELTLPGFIHDICSAIHPLGIGSPFFQQLPLHEHGLKWIQPLAPLAHPFQDGTAAILEQSLELTSLTLGTDKEAYKQLMEPLVQNWKAISTDVLAPFHFPKHPLLMARFATKGLQSAQSLALKTFNDEKARALFAGLAAHANMPLDKPITAAIGLILATLGHVFGWPLAQTGSQKIADALASYFTSLGGKIFTNNQVKSIKDLPTSKAVLCDLAPRQLLQIAGAFLPSRYKEKLEDYRYGPGVCKLDWALSEPIPWKAKACLRAGTVHVGGTFDEILQSEQAIGQGLHPDKPYILLAQQTLFDPTRAPEGKQTAWGYCHVPSGSIMDMTEKIENQIERFAPGFRDCILGRAVNTASAMERYNPNYVGGDITGGVQDLAQLFTRPVARWVPYSTPYKGLYLCSASTPPGGGVHGMCGYFAAKAALKQCFHI